MADQESVNKGETPQRPSGDGTRRVVKKVVKKPAEPASPPKQKEKKDTIKAILLVLVILLVIGNGVLAYLLMNSNSELELAEIDNTELTQEKADLTAELDAMITQYDSLHTDNEALQAEREQQIAEIMALKEQVKNVEDLKYLNYKLRKEAGTLRSIMKGYIHTIDSLNTLNLTLRDEKREIQTKLVEERQISTSLSEQNEELSSKVAIGARMSANDLAVTTFRLKSNNEARPTTRAAKTQKIKCCFTIEANPLTEKGTKEIFMRVIAPNGKALKDLVAEGEPEFEFEGVKGFYTRTKQVEYNGNELEACIYYDVRQELPEGKYIVEIYEGGAQMGSTTFELK